MLYCMFRYLSEIRMALSNIDRVFCGACKEAVSFFNAENNTFWSSMKTL